MTLKGTINVGAQLATLNAGRFKDYVALDQDYLDSLFDDVLIETIRLRDAVRAGEAAR